MGREQHGTPVDAEREILKDEMLASAERGPESGDTGEASRSMRGSVSETPREGQRSRPIVILATDS